jgi:outer membrane protein assembly factor BamB
MQTTEAEIVHEYGPFESLEIHGVSFDGSHVWFASGLKLHALDPRSGEVVRELAVPSDAGTAFDGTHLFQIAERQIHKIEPETGRIVATIPAPAGGGDSGLTWAEGSLWVGDYRGRKIHQIDPETGAIRRTIESNRFVTGVTWVDGELWHGTYEDGAAEIRRVEPTSGQVLARLAMPKGTMVSGLESDGKELLYAGGGKSGKIRAVRRRKAA